MKQGKILMLFVVFFTALSLACITHSNEALAGGKGTFSVPKKVATHGSNTQTGKNIKISAKKVSKFKAGGKLADAVKK